MKKRLFVLVTGMPGSGKSIVADAAREMGIPVYTMGDVVREETMKRYGVITPELMVETSRVLREEYGEEIIALKTIERIPGDKKIVVIDGVRSPREVEVFSRYGDIYVIAVHASPKTRFKRLLERRRPGDPNSYDEFKKRDLTELKFGIGEVIALADYIIVNEGSIEEAKREATRILRQLVEEYDSNRS